MNAKRILIGLMIILILSYFGFRGYQEYLAPVEPTPTPAAIGTQVITVNAEGRVVPLTHLGQAFELSGRISEIHVSEGDLVEEGDTLLSLEKDSLQAQAAQAKAALKAARAQLEMLPDAASEEREEQAEAQVEQAQASLEAAQIQLKKTDLISSLTGVVTAIDIEKGQVVEAGMPVIIVADTSRWQVETLDLLEEDVVNIQVGQPATVKFAAHPDSALEGRVSKIARSASSYQGNVTYTVTVDLPDPGDLSLQWGMTSFVEIDPESSTIPPLFSPTPTPEPTAAPTQTPTPTPEPEEDEESDKGDIPASYTVRRGEFVYCLGRRFDIKPADILSYNGLPPGSQLFPGQIINLPSRARPFPVTRALAPHPTTYIVQPFDTLPIIACKFGDVTPGEIARENDLSPDALLTPGQILDIP
ncbi:MAG: efflux RND transporter periplasmic adaptor subunit [Anaerolineales bacterium]